MTFEYSAEELGLDKKISPKFLDIRRLRPLDNNQPWGIFFIAFDDTKLPVVALRRLLSKLALTKRSTSNTGEHASWNANDLLLISQTSSNDGRSISFAHFASNPAKTDLPILKVLGWDSDDTGLKIDYVIDTLREKLVWPDDPSDSDKWRAQWREAFALKNREVIQSSKEMAERLGQLALAVRTRLREVLVIESDQGPIHKMMSVFKENLISDLDTDSFSDMYAQTIAYGLLSARIINPKVNTADAAHTQIPITNPFLKELMETFLNLGGRSHGSGVGLDFDELGVNEVVGLLDNTNMEAVLRDFGDRNQKEDPVMHFFESFLQEYDSKIRRDRGVFYTPQPVVSFIVRSVDEQLRTEFGLEDGLADTTTWTELAARIKDLEIPEGNSSDQAFVQILDPATGTGTFLVEVIDLIYKTMTEKWKSQGNREAEIKKLWNDYVPMHLLPRLHGYELMMAPYAIAHMKIGLKLYETDYRFESDERARVYLTNALEPAQDFSGTLAFAIPALAHEAEAVNMIKRNHRFTVVIGNPPYSIHSSNLSDLQRSLVERYRFVDGKKIQERGALQFEKNIQDDYVKFFAIGENEIASTGIGILAYITNGNYLDAGTFRGVRASLKETFDTIRLVDLHGDGTGRHLPDADGVDENVFEIKQGVAIAAFSKNSSQYRRITRGDLGGGKIKKYDVLSSNTLCSIACEEIVSEAPNYEFISIDLDQEHIWKSWLDLPSIFSQFSAGVITGRDHLVIDYETDNLHARISNFQSSTLSNQELLEEFSVAAKKGWNVTQAREKLGSLSDLDMHIKPLNYRPFDTRWIFYDSSLVWGRAFPTMQHLGHKNNIALSVCKQLTKRTEDWRHVFVTRNIGESSFVSNRSKEITSFFPIFLQGQEDLLSAHEPICNVKPAALRNLDAINIGTKSSANEEGFTSAAYIYSILHSPGYRMRFQDQLARGFPRIPLPCDIALTTRLVDYGLELIDLHLLESLSLDEYITSVEGSCAFQVEKVSYCNETVWIDKAKTKGFKGVHQEVWNFKVGSYQVCHKWLKDREAKGGKNSRPGRVLTDEDIDHYQKIVVALSETIRIMAEIDVVIEAHGGWPDAFSKN